MKNHNSIPDFSVYSSPFSWRYGSGAMRRLFSEQHKHRLWRKIWIVLAEAQHRAGLIKEAEIRDLRKHESDFDLEEIHRIEAVTGHDVVASLREFAQKAKTGGGKIHLGATSMDIVDNAEALRTKEALNLLEKSLGELISAFASAISKSARLVTLGYTHLQPAEPTTVGYRLAFYAQDLIIHVRYLDFLKSALRAKGIKGAVGSQASFAGLLENTGMTAFSLEKSVMDNLGLTADTVSSQVSTRIYDYYVLVFLAAVCASLSKFAADVRLLQSPLFGEWSEPFGANQVGSSAMPFKKNPVSAEKLCSLARYVQCLPQVGAANAMHSYLERTLDDSANRRVIFAEGFLATDEVVKTAVKIISGLIVNRKRIKHNLETFAPFAATEKLILDAVRNGANRQEIHEEIRKLSLIAWEAVSRGQANPLGSLLAKSPLITRYFPGGLPEDFGQVTGHTGTAAGRALITARRLRNLARKMNRADLSPGKGE